MGVFDTFIFKRKCPECTNILEEWQTKLLDGNLKEWSIGDNVCGAPKYCRVECHDWCANCNKMFSAWAVIKDGKYVNHIIPPRDEEIPRIILVKEDV